jgi:Flp pilus assembly protein TadG
MESLSRLLKGSSGAEIAEAAVILPLLFMLLLGIMWFGRAFNIYATVNHAAREGALAAAAHSCASCGNATQTAANIRNNVVNPILTAAHLDPAQIQNFNLQPNVVLNPASPLPELGTVLSFDYPFNFKLNGLSCCPPTLSPITTGVLINAKAQAKEED